MLDTPSSVEFETDHKNMASQEYAQSMPAVMPAAEKTQADLNRKKIWIISELYWPEETSTGGALTILAEGLAQCYRVGVLCSQPTYNARGTIAPTREVRNGVQIRRCPATTLNKEILFFRIVNLLTISLSIALFALREVRKRDCVVVVTNPPLLPFLITAVCRLRRAKALLLIHDVYPEVLTAIGMLPSSGLTTTLLQRLSRFLYRSVDRIIVLGRDMEALVREKIGESRTGIEIIPNCAHEPDRILPGPRRSNALLECLGLSHKFVVQYSGNMGRTHGFECLLEAMRKLAVVAPEVHFLFIGWGAKKRWLEESVQSLGLANVTVLPYLPREQLAVSLNACDVTIISFVPGMAGSSVPGRMYNIMAVAKPIIAVADAASELGLVVTEEEIGWVVPPNQPDRVVHAVLEAKENPERVAAMGRRARRLVETKYSVPRVIQMYGRLIEKVWSCAK